MDDIIGDTSRRISTGVYTNTALFRSITSSSISNVFTHHNSVLNHREHPRGLKSGTSAIPCSLTLPNNASENRTEVGCRLLAVRCLVFLLFRSATTSFNFYRYQVRVRCAPIPRKRISHRYVYSTSIHTVQVLVPGTVLYRHGTWYRYSTNT